MKTNNILSNKDFKTIIEKKSRLIGIDPGSKNIGIAICDENKIVATPLKTINKTKIEVFLNEINKIIIENDIKGIVIGKPLHMDGSVSRSSQSAADLAENISKNITIPITLWDERLSSEGSFKIVRDLGTNVSSRVKKLDENAAAFILQGAIDYLTN
ncbi:MAG: Holliday junction resolvase RuvX [Candidatus Pelagibacter sp. TMED64]|nr:Holliday junction resolvase RuvX [Candidatus Pelagibacter sp.]OUU67112.1 MAG: Holliday junction resolvase RuvX [Candidatus Pelagibacter sp. TMED64]|tara:strand:+ start:3659 stop:4129 length:471 start_codon:yes stop_codon:yes gene_type:complete